MVVLAEVHSQIFGGEGCPSPISSSSTLLKRVHDIGHKHHWEVCTDRAIITSLASHTIIPSTRAKALVVLSLPCLLSLLHASYCTPSLTLPVSLLSSRRAQIMQECTLHSPPPPASPSFSFSPPPPPSPLTSAPPPAPAPAPAADLPSLQLQLQPSSCSPSSPSLAALRVAAAETRAVAAEARADAAQEALMAALSSPAPPSPPSKGPSPPLLLKAKPTPLPSPVHAPPAPPFSQPATPSAFPSPLVLLSHVKPTTSTSFPTKLPPPSIWGSADSPTLTARYGYALSDLPARLKSEMVALEKVATDPQPNLNRVGVCTTQLQPDTFLRHQKNILRYAGVLVHFLGVKAEELSLWAYTYISHLFLFLSFLQARGVMPVELKKQVQTALMVLAHLGKEEGADKQVLSRCARHLEELSKELGGLHQRTQGVGTNPKVHVPLAAPVVAWQDKVMGGAMQAAAAELIKEGGLILSPQVQAQVRDASMLGLSFGHTSLVTRLTLLRSVKACQFADQACEVEGCVGKRCKGNRLEEVPNPSFSPSSQSSSSSSSSSSNFHPTIEHSKSLYKLCCAHHKNSSKGVPGFEVTIHSTQLHALLVLYQGKCRPSLLRQTGKDLDADPATLFFHHDSGLPLTSGQLDTWFKELQVQQQFPAAQPMPQSSLRHIFTTDRRENPSIPGPSDSGAALSMGNSTKVGRDLCCNCKGLFLICIGVPPTSKPHQCI